MKILNRRLRARELPEKVFHGGLKILTALYLFKNPLSLITHYLARSSPADKCIRFRDGRQMKLSNHDLDVIVLFQVFCERVYGRKRNNSIVLDVGAHIGSFALYAAFNGAKKIYAFEPNAEAYGCMLQNIERNELGGTIVPFRFAVTGKSNETVRIPIAASPQNHLSRQAIEDEDKNYESVGAISLNDILIKEDISCIDLLKLDCEGSEYDIIAATDAATFAKVREIILEYHDNRVEEIVNALKSHGFHLTKHKPETEKMGMLWFNREQQRKGAVDEN